MNGFVVLVIGLLVIGFLCSGGRRATGHSHGGNRAVRARHEAGHVVAGRAVGARIRSATLTRHGGEVDAAGLPDARAQIVFQLAGGLAAGSNAGCSGDNADVRRALREFPASQRAAVLSDCRAEARRIVSSRSGEIRRVARTLDERGRL